MLVTNLSALTKLIINLTEHQTESELTFHSLDPILLVHPFPSYTNGNGSDGMTLDNIRISCHIWYLHHTNRLTQASNEQHTDTVFRRINAPGGEAENESLSLSDINENNRVTP